MCVNIYKDIVESFQCKWPETRRRCQTAASSRECPPRRIRAKRRPPAEPRFKVVAGFAQTLLHQLVCVFYTLSMKALAGRGFRHLGFVLEHSRRANTTYQRGSEARESRAGYPSEVRSTQPLHPYSRFCVCRVASVRKALPDLLGVPGDFRHLPRPLVLVPRRGGPPTSSICQVGLMGRFLEAAGHRPG